MALPHHIAIVMDGNGRWAEARGEPRVAGHRAGIEPVRKTIRACSDLGVEALTLFAFSSENWRRPETEVASIMGLFMEVLDREIEDMHANGIRLRIIGNRQRLSVRLQQREWQGAQQLLRLESDLGLLLLLCDAAQPLGDALQVQWRAEDELRFDGSSGQRLE